MSFIARLSPRQQRHARIRQRIVGTKTRPRLSVFASNRHFYAQIIDDSAHWTLAAFSTLQLSKQHPLNKKTCQLVGTELAKIALKKKITQVVFDRGGFLFHGRIKVFADTLRKEGIKF